MHASEKKRMIELVRKVHEQGITILIVEHDMRSVMELCNYISVLDFGKLLVEGTPSKIQNNKAVIEAYLGTEDISSLGGEEVASRN
jgi:branched-chain amino acid transport system ATP-binding protein